MLECEAQQCQYYSGIWDGTIVYSFSHSLALSCSIQLCYTFIPSPLAQSWVKPSSLCGFLASRVRRRGEEVVVGCAGGHLQDYLPLAVVTQSN